MAALFSSLPAPLHSAPADEAASGPAQPAQSSSAVAVQGANVPPYGQRKGWKPKAQADFGDGGAYPECHVAQYPLELGRKKTSSGNTLALQVDADGNVNYGAIAQQGQRNGVHVQSSFKDLVPLSQRTDVEKDVMAMERPSEEEVQSTTDRTKAALERLVQGKIKAAQPKNVQQVGGDVTYMRYTPQNGGVEKQKIIKMMDVVEDPLEPPRFKGKKIPRGPPSPPPPILRSPPRKVTAQEQKEWMIPPCVSNWKNNKGYTIPLDKRLAADGRGLQDVHINDRFAQFSEALYVADRHAREEVRQRALMQQKIAAKEKEAKEENLRMLAQRAREERSGVVVQPSSSSAAAAPAAMSAGGLGAAMAGYGSDSEDEEEAAIQRGAQGQRAPSTAAGGSPRSDEDEDREEDEGETEEDRRAARERDEMRRERRKERERELRMSHMGTEQRAKVLAKATGRDISEKIALGLAKPTLSKDSMLDARLFNREQYSASFGSSDSYNLYDKPLFSGSSAAAAIYKPRGRDVDEEGYEVNAEEVDKAMRNDRFGLGVAGKGRGFEGTDTSEIREGPVAFERDTADPFGVDAFLESAKAGAGAGEKKRGLDTGDDERRKRQRDD
ncbi:SKIP/SNW domain-containing protein [Rhodotorula diobovata]|uniref:Pre-mRNA-processing protein 45 n=1 Tax=Rhodotorula diobovata TaxID=5288 RepID=A0A5C5FUF6_9BASI|nr:SKIP/SNW domain-containing protein [Rhodotorula diobovata]